MVEPFQRQRPRDCITLMLVLLGRTPILFLAISQSEDSLTEL